MTDQGDTGHPPMPNREPIREGVREISQDPDLFAAEEAVESGASPDEGD